MWRLAKPLGCAGTALLLYQAICNLSPNSITASRMQYLFKAPTSSLHPLEPEWEWARSVSLVYTWVNGSEPEYGKLRVAAGGHLGGERDRDVGDLRYALRSMEQAMPWHTGTVYLLSPAGHVPDWLDQSHPRFKHIDQNDVVPVVNQPTFNSNCIEQFFHLIPGLTEQFIHINDDHMMLQYVHPSVFFTQKRGLKFFPEEGPWGLASSRPRGPVWSTAVKNSGEEIERVYGKLYNYQVRVPEHAPRVYSRKGYEGMHQRFNNQLRASCQEPFRHQDNLLTYLAFQSYVAQEGSRCCGIGFEQVYSTAQFMQWKQDLAANEEYWNRIEQLNPIFFNTNDDMGTGPAALAAVDQLVGKLEQKFPKPSSFEKPPH